MIKAVYILNNFTKSFKTIFIIKEKKKNIICFIILLNSNLNIFYKI